jgi:hypothetical protein
MIRFWDVATGKTIHDSVDYHNAQITGLALSPGIIYISNIILTISY